MFHIFLNFFIFSFRDYFLNLFLPRGRVVNVNAGEMFHSSRLNALDPRTLSPCAGHSGLAFNHLYIIWGGYGMSSSDLGEVFRNGSMLYVYNSHLRRWFCLATSGECPMKVSGTVAVIEGLSMYVVSASYEDSQGPSPVYNLDLSTLIWSKLQTPDVKRPTPRNKLTSWIYDHKLYMFGGYGPPPLSCSLKWPNFEFLEDGSGHFVEDSVSHGYWNNQLLTFDLSTFRWTSCKFFGSVPSARAAHQACLMGDTVVLYGGRHGDTRLNDLYTLDMKCLLWKRIDTVGVPPCGRSWHTLNAVSSTKLVLYGGFSTDEVPLRDMWILDMERWKWSQVDRVCVPRLWHSGAVIDNVLYIYGGCEANLLVDQENHPTHGFKNDLVEFCIGVPSLHNLCHRVISGLNNVYSTKKVNVSLPKLESLRVLASRGASISSCKEKPLLKLLRY